MGVKYKKGDVVRQVVPVIEGVVVESRIIGDDICYNVEYVDEAGETHSRFFKEDEIVAKD